MRKIKIGHTVSSFDYDYMVDSEAWIYSDPVDLKKTIGKLMYPETAITLERTNINNLVWWRVKTENDLEGWVMQCSIIRTA